MPETCFHWSHAPWKCSAPVRYSWTVHRNWSHQSRCFHRRIRYTIGLWYIHETWTRIRSATRYSFVIRSVTGCGSRRHRGNIPEIRLETVPDFVLCSDRQSDRNFGCSWFRYSARWNGRSSHQSFPRSFVRRTGRNWSLYSGSCSGHTTGRCFQNMWTNQTG